MKYILILFVWLAWPIGVMAQDAGQPATDAQAQSAIDATTGFLRLQEAGKLTEAYAMFSPDVQGMMDFDSYARNLKAQNSKRGPLAGLQVLRATRYETDPPRTALDYFAQYRSGFMECGYFIWDDGPNLIRQESGMFPPGLLQSEGAEAQLKAMGCRVIPKVTP